MENKSSKKIILHLTEEQVDLIMQALYGNSANDHVEEGEYSYLDCYSELKNILAKKGINYT